MPRSKPSPSERPWAVIQHVAWEGPGTIADEAAARGVRLDLRRMDLGEPVPSIEEIGGLVVMGGPMSAHDTVAHPHLARERRLLRDAMESDLPILAVCLGSQLLALALDARVERGPMPEVGIGEVALTEEGRGDPVMGAAGASVPVVHWHEDTFHVPDGAVHLAESALYRNQAFRLGDRAYAFQFHMEVDRALAGAWEAKLPAGVRLTEERRADVERAGRGILGRFFDRALGRAAIAFATLGFLVCLGGSAAAATTPPAPTAIVIECDRLFDGVSLRPEGRTRVLVENGRITSVGASIPTPAGAERIDLAGMTLLPGFIDAHTHLSYLWSDTTRAPNFLGDYLGSPIVTAFAAARNAEKTLRAGFTTIREMGASDGIDLALAQAVASGLAEGPRIVTAGPIYPPGGGRTDMKWPPDGTAGTAEEITRKSREYLGQGCDWIKIYGTFGTYDDTSGTPIYTSDEIRAAVEAAHPRGRWVAVHAMGLEGARRAVAAGARSLEHGSRLDRATAREMARRGVYLDPTLYHLQWYSDHGGALQYGPGYAERLAALQKEQFASVRLARDAGVRIACGSDAVYTMHGENGWEMVWLTKAGLSPADALRSATSVNASLLGLEREIGRIAPGYAADLVAVPGDPTKEIEAVLRPAFVMKGGRIIARP